MLVRDIEKALLHAEKTGFGFGPLTIAKGALVHLCRRLEPEAGGEAPLQILELGGGQSTVFWSSLHTLGLLPVSVTTLEHQAARAAELMQRVDAKAVRVAKMTLRQIDGAAWDKIFREPEQAARIWEEASKAVPEEQYNHYTIRNTFYGEAHQALPETAALDIVTVDGPHGNGRSLAFPLFARAVKPGGLILIDDFDHYPFLEDLGKILAYEELCRELVNGKNWVLVRVRERVAEHSRP